MSTKEIKPVSLHYPLDINGKEIEKDILKPFAHLTLGLSKNIRGHLITCLAQDLIIPEDKLKLIHHLIDLLHNNSLLLDDIQDHSVRRRGTPAAHTIYGIPRTVFAVDWVGSLIFEDIIQFNNPELFRSCTDTLMETVIGQGMELYWRDNHICPTEEEYLRMVYKKTTAIFLLVVKAVNTFSVDKQLDVGKLLTAFGVHFQIKDDYQNLQDEQYFKSKGFCEDITEGKFSFPVVHAINNFPNESKEIIEILKLGTFDVEIKKRCLAILEKCGSFEYTKKKLAELEAIINEELAKFNNPLLEEFINSYVGANVLCS